LLTVATALVLTGEDALRTPHASIDQASSREVGKHSFSQRQAQVPAPIIAR
jgi:hypothetical protein